MNDKKQETQQLLLKFMEMTLKHSKTNVPQPMPLIEKKAQERLSTDGLISFKIIIKEFEKVSMEERKKISELLLIASHDLVETLHCNSSLMDDHKDTPDYVNLHPEYGRSENEVNQDSIMEEFKDLFE